MDFFTHLLIGIVLGRLFFKDSSKQKAIAFGSILPDFDIFFVWIPIFIPNLYIFSHRGFFHSFITLIFFFPLIVFILNKILLYNKFQMAKETLSIQITLATYIIGVIGSYLHLFMDLLNPQGVVLFSPLSNQRFTFSTMNFLEPLVSIPAMIVLMVYAFKKYYKNQNININTFDLISRSIAGLFIFFIVLNSYFMVQTINTQKTEITTPGWIFINRWVVLDHNDTYVVKLINQLTQQTEKSYTFMKLTFNNSEITNQQANYLIKKAQDSVDYKKFLFSLDPNTRLITKIDNNDNGKWVVSFTEVVSKAEQMYYRLPENSLFQGSVKITINS